jgi:hypothetical protein
MAKGGAMKKGLFVLVLLLVLSTWVEAQVSNFNFTVKKFVRIEFQSVRVSPSNWNQSPPSAGGCIGYTPSPNSPGPQSLTLSEPDGTTQQHLVNAGQVVFVCGDVAHIPPRVN